MLESLPSAVVGAPAPELVVSGLERRTCHGEPRVLAFVGKKSQG